MYLYSKDPALRERNVKVPRVSKVLGGFKRNHGRRSVGDLPVIYITCSISVISTYMIHTVVPGPPTCLSRRDVALGIPMA